MAFNFPKNIDEVIAQINRYRNFKNNWGCYEESPPSSFTCDYLIKVTKIMEKDIPIPCVCIGSGMLQLEWNNINDDGKEKDLEISLCNEHDVALFLKVDVSERGIKYDEYESGEIELDNFDKVKELLKWLIK